MDDRIGVLFVCLGNICRSPLAEAVFLQKVNERGLSSRFRIDSAGTGGWHVGEPPDHRAQVIAKKNKVPMLSRARQISQLDFDHYEYLICMDEENYETLVARGAPPDRVHLLLEFDESTHLREVPDPFYGGDDGFHVVFDLVSRACDALIDHLVEQHVP